jgi:trigger factor
MALTKKETIGTNQFEIEFSVDKDTFEAAVSAVFAKKRGTISVPGFRKGKAPRHMVERLYGKGVFYEDAINDVMPGAYEAAIKEAELDTVGQPEIDVVSIDDNGLTLKAKVYVKPDVSIADYLGIKAEKNSVEVTDEELEAEIARVRERNGRTVDVTDRAAVLGDIANIDYAGTVDGVAFDGGTAQGHDLKLGSGQFIPGFEDQIVGHTVGEEFDVNVTFPTEYHAEELAGKATVFHCKLNALKMTELPELDDEFAKDVSEFDTLDEYKASVKANMQSRNDRMADSAFEEKLCEELITRLVADIPEVMYQAETENFVRDYDNRLRSQGLDLSTYFKYTGMTLDQLREQMRPMAEKQVKVRLALEKIAALENLTVADEEIEAEYQRISDAYQVPMEQVKAMIDAKDIAADMRVKAAMDLVKEKAVIAKPAAPKAAKKTTKAASDAEKPAKSTTAKTKTASTKSTGTKATASKTAGAKSAPKTTKTKKADASKESESK